MESKGKIAHYRERLDKTLASPELTNKETLKTLIKNQLLHSSQDGIGECSENVVERKTVEVSNFLEMLRSASVSDTEASKSSEGSRGEWKLKQDSEEFRVMYREGPQGTPLHSLLVEGYVEGPVDACMCISWEPDLYKKWWPQYSFPPFKITTSKCLQKVRICEEISLVRVKVTWPLSAREAVVHFFLFEYFQDDLVIVLMNTIDDLKRIDLNTHGFSSDGIPETKDIVRIELMGGFAIQKVTQERSYFRTIAHMDMKLDFVPPSLINFVSRQLVGSGFRLYQKAVASVSNRDEDYSKALDDPLYTRIREALYSPLESKEAPIAEDPKKDASVLPEEHVSKDMEDGLNCLQKNVDNISPVSEYLLNNAEITDRKVVGGSEEILKVEELKNYASIALPEEHLSKDMQDRPNNVEQNVHNTDCASESLPSNTQATEGKVVGEIEEEESLEILRLENTEKDIDQSLTRVILEKSRVNGKRDVFISPKVEQALETLEKAIYMVRECGFNGQTRSSLGLKPPNVEMGASKDSAPSEEGVQTIIKSSETETVEKTYDESRSTGVQDVRQAGSNSYSREVNHNRIAPASSEDDIPNPSETNPVPLSSSQNMATEIPNLDETMNSNKGAGSEANGIHENALNGGKKSSGWKTPRFCCFFPFNSASYRP